MLCTITYWKDILGILRFLCGVWEQNTGLQRWWKDSIVTFERKRQCSCTHNWNREVWMSLHTAWIFHGATTCERNGRYLWRHSNGRSRKSQNKNFTIKNARWTWFTCSENSLKPSPHEVATEIYSMNEIWMTLYLRDTTFENFLSIFLFINVFLKFFNCPGILQYLSLSVQSISIFLHCLISVSWFQTRHCSSLFSLVKFTLRKG